MGGYQEVAPEAPAGGQNGSVENLTAKILEAVTAGTVSVESLGNACQLLATNGRFAHLMDISSRCYSPQVSSSFLCLVRAKLPTFGYRWDRDQILTNCCASRID